MPPKRNTATREAHDRAPRLSLPQLCSEAADHVARARFALHEKSYDADRALRHLDEAILCLKRLLAHGNGSRADLRSA